MKANELMVGDWVQPDSRSYPVQVESLDAGKINGMLDASFDAIPLTPEILEKNGWEEQWGWWHLAGCPFWLVKYFKVVKWGVRPNGEDDDDLFMITSVHELQHILRLCGIEQEIKL